MGWWSVAACRADAPHAYLASQAQTLESQSTIMAMNMLETESGIKTRFLIISDTHSADPSQNLKHDDISFRPPLPAADVLLHCGDLTMVGLLEEYERTLKMLESVSAPLKLVIAGNHDISLDEAYFERKGEYMQRRNDYDKDLPKKARELWTGDRARMAGIMYLDEGTHNFTLSNGALLRIYASPYQPEFCDWAFPYWRGQDRYNPSHQCTPGAVPIAENPIPDFPHVDVMMTHGPPYGIQDATTRGEPVGCEHLLRAARRCKPRLHCFGHIHEAWGARRVQWRDDDELNVKIGEHVKDSQPINTDWEQMNVERAAKVDVSRESDSPLHFGKETLMVNASIMTITYKPRNAPFLVDLDLNKA